VSNLLSMTRIERRDAVALEQVTFGIYSTALSR
jgi:hypothetical protein